jgi:hypothetical protein
LQVQTTEYYAALLLALLVEKMKQTPSFLPERAAWFNLAVQVADSLASR